MNVVRRRTRAVPKVPWPNAAPKLHHIQIVLTECPTYCNVWAIPAHIAEGIGGRMYFLNYVCGYVDWSDSAARRFWPHHQPARHLVKAA